ncbi:MAG: DUF429 domain-containing protein [Cyclobacteriaceae bacterium]|nr:DUF429 domain-containing protein [Cyclobacteriaceae bacterium]
MTTPFHAGIDYGSKMAGTTCLCFRDGNRLKIRQSKKGEDADEFILAWAQRHRPAHIFLDAPLSLPSVYTGEGSDYFYREADRQLGAMSPMFLGGLTARAMRLRSVLGRENIHTREVYPAALARELGLQKHYKKDIPLFKKALKKHVPSVVLPPIANWHQADSLLAWLSGTRFLSGHARVVGLVHEGTIVI